MMCLKFCRICLVTDVRMYNLKSGDSLGILYSQTTGINVFGTCQHICYECVSLLKKTNTFLRKCHRADKILTVISENTTNLTKGIIQKIDRKKNKLESNLKLTKTICYRAGRDVIGKHSTTLNNIIYTENDDKLEIKIKRKKYNNDNKKDMTFDSLDVKTKNLDSNLKEYQPKSVNIVDGNQDAKTQSAKDFIEMTMDDFDEDTVEYLDEDILAEAEESVTNTSKVVEIPNIQDVAQNVTQDITHKSQVQKPNDIIQNDLKGNVSKILYPNKDWNQMFVGCGRVVFMTPEEAKKQILDRQNSENYLSSPYTCNICYRGYGMKSTYDNHMKGHNLETEGYYECDVCHLRFSNRNQFGRHFKRSHTRKFTCTLCKFTTNEMSRAKWHVSFHKGEIYKCKYCDETFSIPNSVDSHIRLKHLNDLVEEFFCDICGNIFATKTGVAIHKCKLHSLDKNSLQGPKCEECGIHFDSEKAWSRHLVLSSKHTKMLSQYNTCKHCGESFTDVRDLKIHIYYNHVWRKNIPKTLLGPRELAKPDPCALCNKTISDWVELDIHMRKVHLVHRTRRQITNYERNCERYVCETCGHAFKYQRQLIEHQRSHTGERPFKCTLCDKRYPTKTSLNFHSKIHDNEKYVCTLCGQILASKTALYKHIKGVHKRIRPFKCMMCDKAFTYKCELKQHIKYVHEKAPWPKRIRKKRDVTNKVIVTSE